MKSIAFLIPFVLYVGEQPESDAVVRYTRSAGGKHVLESEIVHQKKSDGYTYLSVTHRSGVEMRLSISFNRTKKILSAVVQRHTSQGKESLQAVFKDKRVNIVRNDKVVEKIKLKVEPVLVTTAPDWSDIMLLLRRYDREKGGLQKFTGLWFHPSQPARILTFSVERIGHRSIELKAKKTKLGKYRVHLRSGGYLVWADADGLVYKLMPLKKPMRAVVLKGYEQAAAGLGAAGANGS